MFQKINCIPLIISHCFIDPVRGNNVGLFGLAVITITKQKIACLVRDITSPPCVYKFALTVFIIYILSCTQLLNLKNCY